MNNCPVQKKDDFIFLNLCQKLSEISAKGIIGRLWMDIMYYAML